MTAINACGLCHRRARSAHNRVRRGTGWDASSPRHACKWRHYWDAIAPGGHPGPPPPSCCLASIHHRAVSSDAQVRGNAQRKRDLAKETARGSIHPNDREGKPLRCWMAACGRSSPDR
jgi:hypothetical protein